MERKQGIRKREHEDCPLTSFIGQCVVGGGEEGYSCHAFKLILSIFPAYPSDVITRVGQDYNIVLRGAGGNSYLR